MKRTHRNLSISEKLHKTYSVSYQRKEPFQHIDHPRWTPVHERPFSYTDFSDFALALQMALIDEHYTGSVIVYRNTTPLELAPFVFSEEEYKKSSRVHYDVQEREPGSINLKEEGFRIRLSREEPRLISINGERLSSRVVASLDEQFDIYRPDMTTRKRAAHSDFSSSRARK